MWTMLLYCYKTCGDVRCAFFLLTSWKINRVSVMCNRNWRARAEYCGRSFRACRRRWKTRRKACASSMLRWRNWTRSSATWKKTSSFSRKRFKNATTLYRTRSAIFTECRPPFASVALFFVYPFLKHQS